MKKIIALTIVLFSFFFTNYLFAADQDGDVNKDYLTPQAYPWLYGGEGGSKFEAIDGWSRQIPGDKISSLTFYSNGTYLTGVKVNYLYGGSSSAGASTGTAITATLDPDEYIWRGMLYQSGPYGDTSAKVPRIIIETTKGNKYDFGKDNPWRMGGSFRTAEWDNHYSSVVVGFWGNSGSVIDSISLIVATPLKLEFQGIEFDNTVTLGTAEQAFLADSVGINETPETQNMQLRMTYSEGGTSTDSWSNTNGVSSTMGVKMGVEAKAFGFQKVSAEWSYSTTNSYSETVGATTSVNSTVSNTSVFSLIVPAKAIYAMKGTVYQSTASFPYTATFKNPYDDRLFYMTGQLDNATSISTYTQWLDIGYVDDDGNKIIYDKYKDDWGPYNLSLSQAPSKSKTQEVFILDTKESLGIDSITIPMDDPGWMMSEKEIAFRQQNGLN